MRIRSGFRGRMRWPSILRKRQTKGISIQATYIYGHSIDDASSIGGGATVVAQNDKNLVAEESNSAFDVRHRLTGELGAGASVWAEPGLFVEGRVLVEGAGWVQSGGGPIRSLRGAISHRGMWLRWRRRLREVIIRYGRIEWLGCRSAGLGRCGASSIRRRLWQPANGFGTASRNSIEGPGTVSVNSSLSRTFGFGETRSLETRLTASNVFNTVQYSGINTTLNSATFGQVTSAAARRAVQVMARYRF